MKKLFTLFLSTVIICCSINLFAQRGSQHLTGVDAAKIYKGASKITISSKRNTISSIQLLPDQNIPTERSKQWLKNDVLKVPAEIDLIQYNQFNDKIGFTHVRYREHYKGVPVEYGVYYVHNRGGKVVSANGEWYNGINISTTPKITAQKAYEAACNNMNAKVWWHEEEETDNNKLMILPVDGKFTLIYKCDVSSWEPRNREWVYVDATDGSIVKTESRIHETDVEGTAVTAYCGVKPIICDSFQSGTYRLHDYSRGAGVQTFNVSEPNDFTSITKDWDYFGGFDIYALDAHFGAEATYDYYNDNYGWKSVDGAGTQILKSLVHAGGGINAFWDGTYMSYLDGDAGMGVTPLTSLEVCAHELTHGVTEHSSGLVYSCESGGINESMSDIFGCTVRFLYTTYGTWYLGDQFNYLIRNMSNPNEFSNPDCYDGTYWSNCPEVHSGSGVGNFWYYLLSDGGSGVNDVGNSYFVEGLGLVDAGAIAFRSNTVYLTPNSEYADLYDQAVLSAQDLFGGCSNQAVQTANAGYAVNIGGPFQDAVTAIFSPSQKQFCSLPATVDFNNGSLNGTDYLWDFGDGNTSTEMSPSHTYNSAGDYTVTLIVNGVALCNTTDTMVFSSINVQNIGQPLPPSCIPTVILAGNKYGILNLTLADINNSSSNATEGYKDFSCSAFTELVAGNPYVGSIKVGTGGDDLRMWIDYSNDGIFDATELVFSADDVTGVNSFILSTPANALLNTPLRLRIIEDKETYDILDGCTNPERGQCEDYMVYFTSPAAVAPVADFVANVTSVNLGGQVNFTDLSQNVPTSWSWSFSGGTPSTSTLQNPTGITYSTAGVYDVSLTASNAFGSGATTKVGYITVNPVITLCGVSETDLDGGVFYDSGGPSANYQANENCNLHIKPACAKSITVTFSSVSTSSSADVVNIYDGPDANAPLILTTYGNPFPFPTCTGTSGELYITWNSDATGQSAGFGAQWTSVVGGTITPVTNYGASDFNPPYAELVSFTDLSSNIPIYWFWDFGDGNTSTLQNPTHVFSGSGAYNVSLTASNCGGSMTFTQIVTVQGPPALVTKPQIIDVTVGCGVDSFDVAVVVINQGSGDLVYTLKEWEYSNQGAQPNILALTYGADLVGTYQSTIDAITAYYPNYTLATTTSEDAEGLAGALVGKNIFLITKPIGDPAVYTNYASTLNTFVNNGGVVIFCGAAASKADCIFNTGLLSGAFSTTANGSVLDVVNNTHPITAGFSNTIADGPKNTFALDITNGDFNSLIDYTGFNVVGYRDLGLGHVVYLGFDFKNETYDTPKVVIGNTMAWVNSMLIPDFVTIDPSGGGVLDAGGTQDYTIHIDGSGLADGTYQEYFVVTGNDPLNPNDTIWVNVTIGGGLCSSVIADVQCGGNVCFTDSIGGGVTSVSYDFGDGNTSTTDNPCHVYTTSGSYTVTSIICGANGCDTITNTVNIQLVSASITSTGSYIENDPISFNSNSANANSWAWDFGDGGTSTLENPTHTYTADGIYSVTLTATDTSGCSYLTSDDVVILVDAIDDSHLSFDISLFPNPANGLSTLEYSLPNAAVVTVELWNGIGQKMEAIISNQTQLAGKYSYSITMKEAGMYYVKMIVGDKTIWQKLVDVK